MAEAAVHRCPETGSLSAGALQAETNLTERAFVELVRWPPMICVSCLAVWAGLAADEAARVGVRCGRACRTLAGTRPSARQSRFPARTHHLRSQGWWRT